MKAMILILVMTMMMRRMMKMMKSLRMVRTQVIVTPDCRLVCTRVLHGPKFLVVVVVVAEHTD